MNINTSDPPQALAKAAAKRLKEQKLSVGNIVRIRTGEMAGKRGRVLQVGGVPGLDMIELRLEMGGVRRVGRAEVFLLGEGDLKDQPYVGGDGEEGGREEGGGKKRRREEEGKWREWLCRGIRVRVVTEKGLGKEGESYYRQKGVVKEVGGDDGVSVRLDSGAVLERVRAKYLETVVGKAGGRVMVVRGRRKGEKGECVEVDMKGEEVLVRLEGQRVSFGLDDVAEWVGKEGRGEARGTR